MQPAFGECSSDMVLLFPTMTCKVIRSIYIKNVIEQLQHRKILTNNKVADVLSLAVASSDKCQLVEQFRVASIVKFVDYSQNSSLDGVT